MTIESYWAVCHPISYHNNKSFGYQKWIVLICMTVGLIHGSIPFIGWKNNNLSSCRIVEVLSYGALLYIACYIFSAAVIFIILYGNIYRSITKHVRTLNE